MLPVAALRSLLLAVFALFAASGVWAQSDAAYTTVLIGGDTHFGENYFLNDDGSERSPGSGANVNYEKGFAQLKPLLDRSSFALVNLETPLSLPRPDAPADKDYVHWTDPAKAGPALRAAGINAVGLANNHIYDQGEGGLGETLDRIAEFEITGIGAGRTLAEAQAPLIREIDLPGGGKRQLAIFGMFEERKRYRDEYKVYAEASRPGVAPINVKAFEGAVRALRTTRPEVFVIAYPHWGDNYSWATDDQIALGRELVEAGADMVIGHHGHNLQEIERYRGKWILYGIGNFLFDAPGRYADYPEVLPFGLAVELRFGPAKAAPPLVRLYPVLSDNKVSGYQPRPVTPTEAAAVRFVLMNKPASVGFAGTVIEDTAGPAIELAD
jgi:poly-gamma-glutamate capsule biosynthesis protein CapA/YwtB (metallophosphatase superfamily)